jgi:hypothetical protein
MKSHRHLQKEKESDYRTSFSKIILRKKSIFNKEVAE